VTSNGRKIAVVVVDGLRYDAACLHCGWLEGMVEQGLTVRGLVAASLPTTSRPCYATLLTGRQVAEHGISSNDTVRKPAGLTLFDIVRASGGRVAVAGFYFFFELAYGRSYDPVAHCEWEDLEGPVTWGRFYREEDMPDKEVAWRALHLAERHRPELLWTHLNALDDIGHKYGGASREYTSHLHQVDSIIEQMASFLLPEYTMYVTGDHGMGDDGLHRGLGVPVRSTPVYMLGSQLAQGDGPDEFPQDVPIPQWRLGQLMHAACGSA
jgi:predicted AlkP superfamily pyrophosphatase or phosphodiesterase